MHIDSILEIAVKNFSKNGWPNSILFTGEQNQVKKNNILHLIIEELYNGRNDKSIEKSIIEQEVFENNHPDYFYFSSEKIKIGKEKNPEEGSVRNLIYHFLPYASRKGKRRFIYFEDATYINNEAESALLKSLEEPPRDTIFLLSVTSAENLKDTIVSRCVQINILPEILSELPSDEWKKFWYLSGYFESTEYNFLKENNWLDVLKSEYDKLSFTEKDFIIFDNLGSKLLEEVFKKHKKEEQAKVLYLSFLPILFAIRDQLIDGHLTTISPIKISKKSELVLFKMNKAINDFYLELNKKYFGTITPNLSVIYNKFLSKFFTLWM